MCIKYLTERYKLINNEALDNKFNESLPFNQADCWNPLLNPTKCLNVENCSRKKEL